MLFFFCLHQSNDNIFTLYFLEIVAALQNAAFSELDEQFKGDSPNKLMHAKLKKPGSGEDVR